MRMKTKTQNASVMKIKRVSSLTIIAAAAKEQRENTNQVHDQADHLHHSSLKATVVDPLRPLLRPLGTISHILSAALRTPAAVPTHRLQWVWEI